MKNLKKKLRKRTIEAYACACGTPDDCISMCGGNFDLLQSGIQVITTQLTKNVR